MEDKKFLPSRARARAAESQLKSQLTHAQSNFECEWKLGKIPVVPDGSARFKTLGVVGQGAFGCVYKVRHPDFGEVAIKTQPRCIGSQKNHCAIMEARIIHAMDNPFIVKGLGFFMDDFDMSVVIPHAKYGSYRRLMHIQDELLAKPFYAQLVSALKYLYLAKITHGDVKPENLLIFEGGHLKLSDFGLADLETHGDLTFRGTTSYMAPEIVLDQYHGNTVDWWALGVMMFEQLMGRHPYADDRASRKALQIILKNPLEALKEPLTNLTAHAEDLIRRTLEIDPYKRAGLTEASIESVIKHGWFHTIHFNVFLDPSYVIPEFENLKLEEAPFECSWPSSGPLLEDTAVPPDESSGS